MITSLVSADDHVDIGHDKVKSFLDPKFHGHYDDALMRFAASMGPLLSTDVNVKWREQHGLHGPSSNNLASHASRELPSGHTDAVSRLQDMDRDGVAASATYCEVSAFRYLYDIKEGWREATRAFNSALLEFASPDPGRLIVSAQIPLHDIDVAVDEVRWAASAGIKSLQLPVFPAELGLPDYWDDRYYPLWHAISDAGLPVCCHIGLNTQLETVARRDPTPEKGIFVPMVALSTAEALGQVLLTGLFERFPELKFVFVEPGVGWVAWWLAGVDDMMSRQGYDFPGLKQLPSEYFRRQVFLTYIDEPYVLEHARNILGVENLMWSSDYPHPVTSFPNSREIAERTVKDGTEPEQQLLLSGNASRVWNL
ncbi:amidohydrolase family protein [Mycobacterium sp. 94-17]|uniref:amidohydrolase family protein n=1 Tax=Mycobacterium sp. 94-17 TaxID=2986147 RepID=UPI002D1F4CC4|nr:amidohydrolase family protein [Mycobacterium sp. 94-17]MEB4209775.1 amidohydrolase family protein [Mycobacterium sp. 94-17]